VHEEIKALAQAIEALQPETNYIKDYAVPILVPFLSAALGGLVAHQAFRAQESMEIEKSKLDTANKWFLLADGAQQELIAIKQNYYRELTSNPIQRAGAIPVTPINTRPIVDGYEGLSFIVPSAKDGQGQVPKWSQVSRIRMMIENFNYSLELWKSRNEYQQQFMEALSNAYGDDAFTGKISIDDVVKVVGRVPVMRHFQLTELAVALTDDLIKEMVDFLENFPAHVKGKINLKKIKGYGSVLTWQLPDNAKAREVRQKCVKVDFSNVEKLLGELGETVETMKVRCSTGYEEEE